jgi:cyclophilin family peptidyl-prolyl cis-trans isomerase
MLMLTAVLALAGTAAAAAKGKKMNRATLQTDLGDITVRFFPEKAPHHVENFLELAGKGVYDGVLFHRVIPNFMIQTGDPLTKDPATPRALMGTGSYNPPASEKREKEGFIYSTLNDQAPDGKKRTATVRNVKAEFNDISHKRGIVSMARATPPNSASSQFFICVADYPSLDHQYTAFGEVISGMEVADKIAAAAKDGRDNPISPIRIKKVVLSNAD